MNTEEKDAAYIAHTYSRYPVCFVKGKGSHLTDENGKDYIDLGSGIGVDIFGIADEKWMEAVTKQLHTLNHVSNLFYTKPMADLAEMICRKTGMEKVFFSNSGAEANECAIKGARKYSINKYDKDRNVIVTLINGFHGRTITTLAATGQEIFHKDFYPFTEGFLYTPANDLPAFIKLCEENPHICAVMVEPIQGEGGVVPASNAFLQGLRELCNRHNALLIFDEVQTGVGRTGELYAYMHYGVTPDLLTTAKALGGGFPVGALLATEECARVMTVGTHGTTYGGNPLASAVAGKVLELINTPEMLNGVKQRHDWFVERLNTINHRYGLFSEVRGLGLLIGCVLNADYAGQAKQISQEAAKAGVMVLIAGGNVVRFAPALNVSEEEVTTGLDRFAAACEHFVSRGSS